MTEIKTKDGGQKDALLRRANIKKNFDRVILFACNNVKSIKTACAFSEKLETKANY